MKQYYVSVHDHMHAEMCIIVTYSRCKLMPDQLFNIAHILSSNIFQLMHMVKGSTLFADSAKLANWRRSDTVFCVRI